MASSLEVINAVIELIRGYMDLEKDQVVLYNQNWKIPSDQRLYITVGLLAEKPYGSSGPEYRNSDDGTALLEVVTLLSQETYSINVYSFGPDALARKEEVLMAFNSTMGQQTMEQYSFKLPHLSTAFVDLSEVEGAVRLYRYQITVAVLRARSKESIVQYYDNFQNPPKNILINP